MICLSYGHLGASFEELVRIHVDIIEFFYFFGASKADFDSLRGSRVYAVVSLQARRDEGSKLS